MADDWRYYVYFGICVCKSRFNSPKQHQLREKTTTHAISSIEKTSNGLKVIQQDTLSSHQIKETL